ncbi:MAG: hypothetical protein HKN58_11750 [Xanthomonadales bacterium]|nr:hypothetical protein [Xanthomonadales bacterium]
MAEPTGPYAYLWRFRVNPRHREAFERHYAPGGSWSGLFSQSPGYLGTILIKDRAEPLSYITIDRWQDEAHYRAFRAQFEREYAELDAQCEHLTESESLLGEFTELAEQSAS